MLPLRNFHADERGVALIAAMLAVIILSGVAVVLVITSVAQSRATGSERDFENALHVAEAGTDEVISVVNADEDHITSTSCGEFELDVSMTEGQQRRWAIDEVINKHEACDLPALRSGERGDAFGFRPVDSGTGAALDVIFGVSFVPNFDASDKTRVIKLQYDRELFSPAHGIQTCGDLQIGGSAVVEGDNGSVHANGDVNIDGNGYSIEQSLTASGSISGTTANAGSSQAHAEDEFCPEIEAKDFYVHSQKDEYTCYENPGEGDCAKSGDDKPILWYDLCPDGHARKATGGSTPCAGESVWTGPSGNWNGWKFGNGDWKAPNGIKTGIYYVYRSNVDDINGGGGAVTVFVEADPDDLGSTGNFGLRGNASFVPALPDVLFIADRDIQMNGSSGGGSGLVLGDEHEQGFSGAGEQVKLDGTATVNGSVYAEDKPHTVNSPVAVSTIKGNYRINYEVDLNVPMTGIVRITAWNELRN